jgi:atypical dual specificity phosphatase
MGQMLVDSLNFSWLEDNAVAGCAAPMLQPDLDFLKLQGVKALVRLGYPGKDDYVLESTQVVDSGLEDLHLPVEDFHAPTQAQIEQALAFVSKKLAEGKPVAVCCGAGCGRTGTILACFLVTQGLSPEKALQHLIGKRPCSREILERTPEQQEAVFEFARLHAAA